MKGATDQKAAVNAKTALEGQYKPWEQVEARRRNYLTLNWPHTAHNSSREIPICILTIITFWLKKFILYYSFSFHFYSLLLLFFQKLYFSKTNSIYIFNFCSLFCFVLFRLYFWETYSRFLIFAFCYLLPIFLPLKSNFKFPFSLRVLATGLIALDSLLAQLVTNLPTIQETLVWFLGQEDLLRKG